MALTRSHHPIWQALLKTAILGSERQTSALPDIDDDLSRACSKIDWGQPESGLLTAAAFTVQFERAGQILSTFSALSNPPCDLDETPTVSQHAGQYLWQMLAGTYTQCLLEWLRAVAARQRHMSAEYLPALLDAGHKNRNLIAAIRPVLGKRGAWLATHNPDWAYAVGADVMQNADEIRQHWQTESRATRTALLRDLRSQNVTLARELLNSTWASEDGESREAFIAALAIQSDLADETFLEAALNDRRKGVRSVAADLLAGIVESRLCQRMAQRAQPLLQLAANHRQLIVTLPAECDSAMQRDGIELNPPKGVGKQAHWLSSLLAATPLAIWPEALGVPIAKIVDLASKTEWKKALYGGWGQAATRQRDAAWATALMAGHLQADLFAVLPPDSQSELLAAQMPNLTGQLCVALLAVATFDWDKTFARVLLKRAQTELSNPKNDGAFVYYLPEMALRLPLTLLPIATQGWPDDPDTPASTRKHIDEFIATLQFRSDMLKEI